MHMCDFYQFCFASFLTLVLSFFESVQSNLCVFQEIRFCTNHIVRIYTKSLLLKTHSFLNWLASLTSEHGSRRWKSWSGAEGI